MFFIQFYSIGQYINSTQGLGQYGYLEVDATTHTRLETGGGDWRELAARWWTGNEYIYYANDKGACNSDGQSTINYSFSNHSNWSAGTIAYVSARRKDCSYNWSGNMNERSFMLVDVSNTGYGGSMATEVVDNPTGTQNLVGTFTISAGSNSLTLNRLWIRNTGTAQEGTDIPNAGIRIYYEAVTGSEQYNGNESNALIYGDYGGNATNNKEYGHDALGITIPSGGLRVYIVVADLASGFTLTRTVQFEIINDGITLGPNRDTNFGLLRVNTTSTSSTASVLPISLTHFSATPKSDRIELNWATDSEQNNDYMAVEKSADALRWQELGRVAGAGTTTQPQSYSFTDEKPLPGLNYYRLRQVDYDGRFEYHKTIAVDFKSETGGLHLFPSPAQERLNVALPAPAEQDSELWLLDAQGRVLQRMVIPQGGTQGAFEVSALPEGVYFVRMEGDARSFRFVR